MSNNFKPLSMQTSSKHLSLVERKKREEAEKRLKAKAVDILKVPSHLDKIAKAEYKYVLKKLGPDGLDVISDNDKTALLTYCSAVSIMRQAEAHIEAHGIMLGTKPNPMLKTFESYSRIVKTFSTSFGLTPADRARLSVSNLQKEQVLSVDSVLQSIDKRKMFK